MTADEDFLFPSHMCVVVLVTDGHSQGAGHRFGWSPAVAHNDRNEELFLALTVEHPESRQRGCAVQVVLKVEVIAVAVLGRDIEVEGRTVLCRVQVHSSEEGGRLVQSHYLNREKKCEGSWLVQTVSWTL